MWFNRVLLGYYAASLAVAIVTAAFTKDATVPKRYHEVERLTFPSLERRQQSAGNQTSSTESIVPTSNDATSSSISTSPETFQSSISVATTTSESLHESISSAFPLSTQSEHRPGSISITLSSSNVDISTTSLQSTENTTPSSSAAEQQPSQTSATLLPSLSQDASSEHAIPSTILEITSATSSFTDTARTSSSVETATSSNLESAPVSTMTSETVISSTATPSISASISVGRNSQAQSDTAPTLASDSGTSITSIEAGSSTLPAPTISTFVPVSSSEVVSTSVLTSQSSATTTTSIEPQPSSFVIPSLEETSMRISTPAISVASSRAQMPVSSSVTSSPGTEGQTSSSSIVKSSSSAAPELTTVAVPSSTEFFSVIQTSTLSEAVSSKPVSSTFESKSTSLLESTASTIEGTQPTPSSSFRATSAVSIGPVEQPLSSNSADPTPIVINVSSSITDQPSKFIPSFPAMVPASSTQIEQDPTVSEGSGSPTSSFSSQAPQVSSYPITDGQSSFFPAPIPSSSPISAQLPPFPSETGTFLSSSAGVTTIVSISLAPMSSQLAPSPIFVETGASISISSEAAIASFASATVLPSASLGTSFFSSVTAGSELVSSFLPSETLVSSAFFSMVSSAKSSDDVSQVSYLTATLSTSQSGSPGSSPATSARDQLPSGVITAPESQITNSQASSVWTLEFTSSSPLSASSGSLPSLSSLSGASQVSSSRHLTSTAAPSITSSTTSAIPTSETPGPSFVNLTLPSAHTSLAIATFSGISSFASPGTLTSRSSINTPLPSFVRPNGTQITSSFFTASGTITATFSTVYISRTRSPVLDLSTVAFSLFSSVTGAAVNQTNIRTSSNVTATTTSQGSEIHIPASESIASSTVLSYGANSTWTSPLQPSLTATSGSPGSLNTSRSSTVELGITFSRSTLPKETTLGTTPISNATQAETLQTSSGLIAVNSTTAGPLASTTSGITSDPHMETQSSMVGSSSEAVLTTEGAGTEDTKTSATSHAPTSSPSQTVAAGSPPPLTTSQTAGVAVGATTGLLIAVVAAIFIARRYHAAKHGKRMSTGSVYPKVAYLYDPKTGGYGGDAEALMSSATVGPSRSVSKTAQGVSGHMQRHSTGTIPVTHFTSLGNSFTEALRDPAIHRNSEYARIDTARALSAAVTGYDDAARHSSSYTKYPSDVTNSFSDHIIPSPTFAPFSPDDIRRPELKTPHNVDDGRGEYSQMSVNPYAYLNTPASMYPPVSPYGRLYSSTYDTRRQTIDSDPFADPFAHDLILHVDEQNRTSDSMTIFALSPNLKPPRTPRTPVGPKLPVRQPNGMTSARSLLSPVAAKYLHKAQEVKILQKSVASPVIVQVGRSPVIQPFSPPPAAPEPLGWDDIKRNSEKHFSDVPGVPAPLKFASPVMKKKPVPTSHTRTQPSLTGAGQALLASNGLPLTVKIPHRYSRSVGLDVPRVHARPDPAHEGLSSDPVVREKRSRELRFADPALIGKEF